MIIGFNGSHTAENLEPQVRAWVLELLQPGQTVVYRLRNDKYTGAMENLHITNVITLNTELIADGKSLQIIYVVSTRNNGRSISDNLYGLHQLQAAGLNIVAVELGNEEFFPAAGHGSIWSTYQTFFEPILFQLQSEGFTGKYIFPVTPGSEFRFSSWDTPAKAYIATNSEYEPVIHLYYNYDDLASFPDFITEVAIIEDPSAGYLANKDAAYKLIAQEVMASDLLVTVMTSALTDYPGKKCWFTEFGPTPNTANVQNVLGFHMADFYITVMAYELYKDNISAWCKHNGPTTPLTGIISSSYSLDVITTGYTRRLGYFTQQLINKYIYNVNLYGSGNVVPFVIFDSDENLIKNANISLLEGNYYYSSSGRVSWWDTGSAPTYEISSISNTVAALLPAKSYGFYRFPIEGCTDMSATNYDSEAEIDDGSCTYDVTVIGRVAYVTDSNAPVFGEEIVGGASTVIPVFYDGAKWIAH